VRESWPPRRSDLTYMAPSASCASTQCTPAPARTPTSYPSLVVTAERTRSGRKSTGEGHEQKMWHVGKTQGAHLQPAAYWRYFRSSLAWGRTSLPLGVWFPSSCPRGFQRTHTKDFEGFVESRI
jgi:hypothetical protein